VRLRDAFDSPERAYIWLLGVHRQSQSGTSDAIPRLSDDQLRDQLDLTRWIQERADRSTTAWSIANVVGCWCAQALRNRQFRREFPHLVP
jgi:hypothetical protein